MRERIRPRLQHQRRPHVALDLEIRLQSALQHRRDRIGVRAPRQRLQGATGSQGPQGATGPTGPANLSSTAFVNLTTTAQAFTTDFYLLFTFVSSTNGDTLVIEFDADVELNGDSATFTITIDGQAVSTGYIYGGAANPVSNEAITFESGALNGTFHSVGVKWSASSDNVVFIQPRFNDHASLLIESVSV